MRLGVEGMRLCGGESLLICPGSCIRGAVAVGIILLRIQYGQRPDEKLQVKHNCSVIQGLGC